MSTGNGSTWRQRWPELLDGLTAEQRRAVITAVAGNVLEGRNPERHQMFRCPLRRQYSSL
jgi:hypothetical protein